MTAITARSEYSGGLLFYKVRTPFNVLIYLLVRRNRNIFKGLGFARLNNLFFSRLVELL